MSEYSEQESAKAAAAFHDYCLLGSGRSLATLAQKYGKKPTYIRQLERWSSQYHWQERVKHYEEEQYKAEEEAIAEERKKVLRSEYALMHKRVHLLNRKIKQLTEITDSDAGIWLDDVKSVGTGKDAERVDLKVFNADAFKELREFLDDIAAEMGERVKKTETAITALPPNVYIGFNPDEQEGSEE